MEARYINAIAKLAQEFNQENRVKIVDKAKELYSNELFKNMVYEWLSRKEKEAREFETDVANYLVNGFSQLFTECTVLTHSSSYKDVLLDMLLERK